MRAAALLLVLLALPARADDLRWGGDPNGGGPYILTAPDGSLSGFEVELAGRLGSSLGRTPRFVAGAWERLPQLMDRGDIDCVLNGYEWTPEREAQWTSTVPYYAYTLRLMARRDDASIRGWEDLRKAGKGKRKVGVLGGSAAERLVRERFGDAVEIACCDGVTNVMRLVEQRQLDACVEDGPIAIHYGPQFPELAVVGEPEAPGWYVLLVRKGDSALKAALDRAIAEARADGSLERIFRKYGIWDGRQASLAGIPWPPAGEVSKSSGPEYAALLAKAAWTTVELACLAMPLAVVLGLLVAIGRLYGPKPLRWLLEAYVEVLRGTPVLLQLYVIFYLLPGLGIRIEAFWAGVLGLGINYSAYEAENYRAGLLAVPKGQQEAALALGMAPGTVLRRILVPQAVRIVIPPVTNDFISLFKDTSVCSVITVTELTGRYNNLYNNHPRDVLALGGMAAVLYLLMSYPLSLAARRLERR